MLVVSKWELNPQPLPLPTLPPSHFINSYKNVFLMMIIVIYYSSSEVDCNMFKSSEKEERKTKKDIEGSQQGRSHGQ